MPKSLRPRRGRAFWAAAVEDQKQSALSIAKFCAERGLHPQTFYAWRRRLQQADQPTDLGFVELTNLQSPVPSCLGDPMRRLRTRNRQRCDGLSEGAWPCPLAP